MQKYRTNANHYEHQIRLVSTYFPVHRQVANLHARYIHRASCSGDWILAENRCSWGHGYDYRSRSGQIRVYLGYLSLWT